jgi:hypothetical protein
VPKVLKVINQIKKKVKMIAKLIVGIMFLCFVGVIVGMVYIGKWSDEAMDQIMKEEEIKRQISKDKSNDNYYQ